MKFKPGNLYIVTKENHGSDFATWGLIRPFCLKTHKCIDLKTNDIFLFLEEYTYEGSRYPTNIIYKILLNNTIHCIGAEELKKDGCKLVKTEQYKLNKNSVVNLVKKSLKSLYTTIHVRIYSRNSKRS